MRVFAVDGQYFEIKKLGVTVGRPLSDQELARGEKSVVLGPDAAERLFPGLDPIGRDLKMGGVPYTVVDVTENAAALEYVSDDLGYSAAPIVVVDEHNHWAGFRPDLIAALAQNETPGG